MSRRPRASAGLLLAAALALSFGAACRESPGVEPRSGAPLVDLLAVGELAARPETRLVVFGAGDRSHLLDGWSIDEHDQQQDVTFVWATAPQAEIAFELLQVEDLQFLMKLRSFSTPVPQEITVLANGHEVSRFSPAHYYLEYRFVVRASDLKRGTNRLTFRHRALGKPPSASPQSRSLAAAYQSITIGPLCRPLRGFSAPSIPGLERMTENEPPLRVIGPIELSRRLDVPPGALLRYRIALPAGAKASAITTVRVLDAAGLHDVATGTLSRSFFRATAKRSIEADLSPWSGQSVELTIEIVPKPCRASVTTVILERAGIYAAKSGGSPA